MPNNDSTFGTFRPRGLVALLVALARGASTRWVGRRWAYLVRAVGLKVLRGRPLDVEVIGARMRLYPAKNNVEKKLSFTPQYFDADERAFLKATMPDDVVFVDIGADVGAYALFVAAESGPRARILAVEPQPDIFERLVFNIRENGFSCIKALACAVSDRDDPVTLFVNPMNSGETSMRTVDAHPKSRQVRAEGRTLARLLTDEAMTRVDVLKLDVEGAEDIILEPFFREGPRALWPGVLIVEDLPSRWGTDLHALFGECGYALVRRTEANLIYRRS